MDSSKNNDENNKFIDHLNEFLSIENALIKRLERRLLETPIKDSKNLLQQHLKEEKGQQRRLMDLITSYGKKPTDSKADIISLHSLINEAKDKMKKNNVTKAKDTDIITKIFSKAINDNNNNNNNKTNINSTIMTSEESEILNTKEDALIKNNEISSYKKILKIAEGVMDKDAINTLKQNLQEKESMYDKIKSSESKLQNEMGENNNDNHNESFKVGSAVADMLTSYWNSQENPSKVYLFNRRVHHGAIGALLGLSSLYKKNPLVTGILSGLGAGLQKDDHKDSKEWFLFRKKEEDREENK
jgi:ferritin-like metal-binding protein YciE